MAQGDDDYGMPGLGGTASAFQAGWKRNQPDKQSGTQQAGTQQQGKGGLLSRAMSKLKGGDKAAQGSAQLALRGAQNPDRSLVSPTSIVAQPSIFKSGGRVKKTGLALVHKGEIIVPAGKGRSGKKGLRKRMITKP